MVDPNFVRILSHCGLSCSSTPLVFQYVPNAFLIGFRGTPPYSRYIVVCVASATALDGSGVKKNIKPPFRRLVSLNPHIVQICLHQFSHFAISLCREKNKNDKYFMQSLSSYNQHMHVYAYIYSTFIVRMC